MSGPTESTVMSVKEVALSPSPGARTRAVWAARAKEAFELALARRLWRRGWRPRVVPFTGYGVAGDTTDPGWARLLGRVLLAPPRPLGRAGSGGRGWRRFATLSLPRVELVADLADLGGGRHRVRSGPGGYFDQVIPCPLPAGWHELELRAAAAPPARLRLRLVDPSERLGVVSDIDDTVMVTALPRPLLAFWNTFVRHEATRRPVPGMVELLDRLRAAEPACLVVYVSTGAWNVAPSIERFLDRHGYPPGPLLMTDWGPTSEAWFRSGRAHKHDTLRRLLAELPWLRWALVGDDGQHDPQLYEELAADAPEKVRVIAIRQLSRTEQVLTHGTPVPPEAAAADRSAQPGRARVRDDVLRLSAADGCGLVELLARREEASSG